MAMPGLSPMGNLVLENLRIMHKESLLRTPENYFPPFLLPGLAVGRKIVCH